MLAEQTTKIMSNAIVRYAKEHGVENKDCQLVIRANDDECNPVYDLCVNWKRERQLKFNEILNVKFDMLGREMMATPFIRSSLKRLVKEKQCNWNDLRVFIYTNNAVEKILMTVYVGNVNSGQITFEYLFGDM